MKRMGKMTKIFQVLRLIIALSILCASGVAAQDVTLSWDPSPTPDVAGYYVYYNQGQPTFNPGSTDANEGPSPIDAGDVLTTTLTGLTDNSIYYFSVTAYDSERNESSFSNTVSNSWVPSLLLPEDNAVDEPVSTMFRWTTEASGTFTYTLYYGTDAEQVGTAGSITNFTNPPSTDYILLVLLLALLVFLCWIPTRPKTAIACGTLSFCLALTSCGGGGGGDGDSSSRSSTQSPPAATLFSVDKGTSDYHEAFAGDLEEGTTYFWKVVAIDSNNLGQVHSSVVASFTTESLP